MYDSGREREIVEQLCAHVLVNVLDPVYMFVHIRVHMRICIHSMHLQRKH